MKSDRGQGQQGAATDEFRQRMEVQCREIKQYQKDVIREQGRSLSQDEAALEWIARYAETFDQKDETA